MADKSEAAAEAWSEDMLVRVQKPADVAFPRIPLIPTGLGLKVRSVRVLPLLTLFAGLCWLGVGGGFFARNLSLKKAWLALTEKGKTFLQS